MEYLVDGSSCCVFISQDIGGDDFVLNVKIALSVFFYERERFGVGVSWRKP